VIHRKPLSVFFAVQGALFYRELGVRFSEGRAGLFWTFFEPFMQIIIFVLIKTIIFGRNNISLDFTAFLALNFVAFNMFKNIVKKSSAAFKANKSLFIYKQVKPIDTVIARVAVEVYISSILFLIFFIIGFYLNNDIHIQNLNMVAFGFISLILFSFAFALLVATLNIFFPSVGKIVNFFMMGLMFGSAVIYTIDMTPQAFTSYILYNPLTHFMEIIHGFYFYSLDDRYVDYNYILIWTLSLLYVGLWLYYMLEKRIISK